MIKTMASILALAALSACGGSKYVTYDEYTNAALQSKLKGSKNVWVRKIDYNNDLIIAELKNRGFAIDASKADYVLDVADDGSQISLVVWDAKGSGIAFSKVATFKLPPRLEDRRNFIRESINLFSGTVEN